MYIHVPLYGLLCTLADTCHDHLNIVLYAGLLNSASGNNKTFLQIHPFSGFNFYPNNINMIKKFMYCGSVCYM